MYQQLKRVSMALALGSVCFGAFAQQKTIKGTVKDSNGEPMIGVSVVPEGMAGLGSVTDLDGNFSINGVNPSTVLKFTYIGYKEKKVKVGAQNSVDIVMEEDNNSLDELVVIGYGVVKKRDLTGSVASIKSDDLKNVASSNAMQAMQAKIPGMDLQQSSGESGSGVSINLRGARSMLASNNPLILVDGVAYGSTLDLNPSDIESMEVLKDASSTAIYGARGANGVIIISTTGTIDGCRRSILQYVDALNLARSDVADRAYWETVYDVERRVVLRKGTATTHPNLHVSIR